MDFCDGNHCAAALISFFEYWHNIRLDMRDKAKAANRVAESHGEPGTQDESLYQFHTTEDLMDGMIGLFKQDKIRASIEQLRELGVITVHRNPNPRYKFDNTRFFLFNPDALIFGDRPTKNRTSDTENRGRSTENQGRSTENRGTITETTTETTTEIKNPPVSPTGGNEQAGDDSGGGKAKRKKQDNPILSADDLVSLGVDAKVAAAFIAVRNKKRAFVTLVAIEGFMREADKAGISLGEAIRVTLEKGWTGFRVKWYANMQHDSAGPAVRRHGGPNTEEEHEKVKEAAKKLLFGVQHERG